MVYSRRLTGRGGRLLLCLGLAAGTARGGGFIDAPPAEARDAFRPYVFYEGAIAASLNLNPEVDLDLNLVPQVGAYYEFRRSWQAGVEIRSWMANAHSAYDFLPEADLHLRKVWLAAEESQSLRNSEYVDVAAGVFPGYRFLSVEDVQRGLREPRRAGLLPQIRVIVGKYWMPAATESWGLDFSFTLGHYFQGHPPGFGHADVLMAALSLVYAPPAR